MGSPAVPKDSPAARAIEGVQAPVKLVNEVLDLFK
jgi:hypothetical protein